MIGTIVNVAAVLIGGTAGLLVRAKLPQRYMDIAFQGIGLVTLAIGVSMTLESQNIILAIISIVVGSLIGEACDIERRMDSFANLLKQKTKSSSDRFTEGFVTASMLFCVGSMAVLGSFEDGMGLYPKLLYTKSLMDGIAALALASSFGVGVLFSIFPVFVYQGLLTLFVSYVANFMNDTVVGDLTSVGGMLLLGLGLSILNIKKISVINMLPALVIIVVLSYLFGN